MADSLGFKIVSDDPKNKKEMPAPPEKK